MDEETLFPFDEAEQLRRDEAAFFVLRGREKLGQAERYPTREPCRNCQSTEARLIRRGGHNQVFCAECGYWIYNAPKTETGVAEGLAVGATEDLLNDDLNLAAMCEACNLGLGNRSVHPATYVRTLVHILEAARGRGS